VVHSLAGWVALVAMILVGPRLGRFGRRGRVIEGHSLPIAALGVFLLWFGWFGFNAGSTFAFTADAPMIMVNTALAGAVGGLVGMAANDFSTPVKVENESEASQVASFHNAVQEKFNIEIDRRKIAIQRLADLANHDPLTGLGNRRLFLDELRRAMNEAHPARQGALMFLDLDGFKAVNDTVGHDAGDTVLKDVASRLRGIFGERGVLGRLGGDEFAVVVEALEMPERDAAARASRFVDNLDAPFTHGEQRLRIGVSVGIVLFGDGALATVKGLTKRADEAMYEAKLAGKGTFRFFGRTADA